MTAEILDDLKGENNQAFGQLYKKYFKVINRFVVNNSGTITDAEDLFQNTMIVFVEKLRQDDFELTASIKTYIVAIAKNLWLKNLRKTNREIEFCESLNDVFYEEINNAIEQEKTYLDKLQNFMHQISAHCKGLIHDIFFKEKDIDQIQKEYGYSTRHNAQNQKHKCVEQIRKVKTANEKRIKK
mgnify:CR=1 FL=1